MDDHPSSPSLAKRLRISLERPQPERDPQTGRPQILYDYAEGGAPVWKQEESQEEALGKVVRRIWEEKGGLGDYTQYDLDEAIAIAEEDERNNSEGVDEPMAGTGDEENGIEHGQDDETEQTNAKLETGISPEQMKELKTEISDRLGQSQHALSTFHHILTLLLPSTHTPAASLALPPHIPLAQSSFATSRTLPKPPIQPPPLTQLAEKQEALRQTAEMFRTSGEELGTVVSQAEQEWEVALGVRELGGWAVGLRGVERAFMGGDKKRDARDWIGWYALDAAPPSFRHRHFAHLPAPDGSTSSSTPPSLVFPNRTRRRLQVTLHQTSAVDGSVTSSSSACVAGTSPEGDNLNSGRRLGEEAAKQMDEAMWESVEEETFAEIIAEARQIVQTLPSRITSNSISLDVSPGLSMTISLVIPPSDPPTESPSSAYPTLLTSLLSLSLLSLHSHRSTVISRSLQPVKDPRLQPSALTPAIGRPRVLQSVVEVVQFGSFVARVRGLLETLQTGLAEAGISMQVDWEGEKEGWEAVEVGGKGGVRVREDGRKAFVRLGGIDATESEPTFTLHLLPASRMFFILPQSNLTTQASILPSATRLMITDLAHLAELLALEIKRALLTSLSLVSADLDGEVGFVDRLKGIALCQWKGGEVRFEPVLVEVEPGTFKALLEIGAVVRDARTGEERDKIRKAGTGVSEWAKGVWEEAVGSEKRVKIEI